MQLRCSLPEPKYNAATLYALATGSNDGSLGGRIWNHDDGVTTGFTVCAGGARVTSITGRSGCAGITRVAGVTSRTGRASIASRACRSCITRRTA